MEPRAAGRIAHRARTATRARRASAGPGRPGGESAVLASCRRFPVRSPRPSAPGPGAPDVRWHLARQLVSVVDGARSCVTVRVPVAGPGRAPDLALSAFGVRGWPVDGAAVLVVLRSRGRRDPTPGVAPTSASAWSTPASWRVAVGHSTQHLASVLHFSRQNIDYRVTGLLRRFDVPNRTALVSRAFSTGLLEAGAWPPKVVENFIR
ncbi:hypothetical protein NKH77_00885 [Streptomyces sp. M19]